MAGDGLIVGVMELGKGVGEVASAVGVEGGTILVPGEGDEGTTEG
jgi:hypothetical protein